MKEKILSEFEDLKKWFTMNKIIAFLTTFIIGIVTHIKIIVGLYATQDGLSNGMAYIKPSTWELALGRWGIVIFERLNNFIMIPSVATVSCILLLSIASIFIVDLFNLKNKFSIIVVSILTVLCPSITITFLYVHTSLAYCMNFLLGILVIWFIYKIKYKKVGLAISTLLFSLVLSIYQSYIGVVVGLCVMYNLLTLLKNEVSIKDLFINICKAIFVVIIGAIIYYILTIIVLKISNIAMSTYNGANNVSIITIIANLKNSIIYTYKDFYKYFMTDEILYNTNYRRDLICIVLLVITMLGLIVRCLKIKGETKKIKILKIVLSIILFLLIPVSLNIIDIVMGKSYIYALTSTQLFLIFPFIFAMLEEILDINIIYVLFGSVIIYYSLTYYISTNVSYTTLELTYNQSYNITSEILYDIRKLEDESKSNIVMFAGIIDLENFDRVSNLYDFSLGFGANNTVFHGDYIGQIQTWNKFLDLYFGVNFTRPDEQTYYDIVNSEEFKEMEIYPKNNSIKIINDVIVVKLKENPAMPY